MANMQDYVAWRGDLPFSACPLNEIDALVLCQLAYLDFTALVPHDFTADGPALAQVAERFAALPDAAARSDLGPGISPLTAPLLAQAAQSIRFGSLRLSGFVQRTDTSRAEQFAAVTFSCADGWNCVVFRGTDGTIVGWKEDFNLGYLDTVPSQADALRYLEAAAQGLPGDFVMAGHSKGGNLAIYAASCAVDMQERIRAVYDNDGPGFKREFFDSPGYGAIAGRVHSFVPEESIVGMLFCHAEPGTTVQSTERLAKQHDPFTWQLLGTRFVELPQVNRQSRFIGTTLNQWIDGLSLDQRELFIETVFGILLQTDAETTADLTANGFGSAKKMVRAASRLDAPTRDAVLKAVGLLVKNACGNVDFLRRKAVY